MAFEIWQQSELFIDLFTAELGLPCCAAWAFCSCEVGFSLWWLLLLWSCLNFTCSVPFSKLRAFLSGLPCPPAGDLPNPGIENPGLLHCRWILYQLSHRGNPRILEWVAYPFSCRPSQPRNQIGVSGIAGRFFTNWAIREAPLAEPFASKNEGPQLLKLILQLRVCC